jgi:hypothetical protein
MSEDDSGGLPLTRRQLVAAGGGAILGGAGGVLAFGDVLGGGGGDDGSDGPRTIEKEEPDGNSEATLGELYYLLEEGQDGAAVTVDVKSFTYDEGVIEVSYRSGAASKSGRERWNHHLEEMGHVVQSYTTYVQVDGPDVQQQTPHESATAPGQTTAGDFDTVEGHTLVATVTNPYEVETATATTTEDGGVTTPAQHEKYGIKRSWVRQYLAGRIGSNRLINLVNQSQIGVEGTTTSG